MAVGDQIGSDGMILKGYGTFGVSSWDTVTYHGASLTVLATFVHRKVRGDWLRSGHKKKG